MEKKDLPDDKEVNEWSFPKRENYALNKQALIVFGGKEGGPNENFFCCVLVLNGCETIIIPLNSTDRKLTWPQKSKLLILETNCILCKKAHKIYIWAQ